MSVLRVLVIDDDPLQLELVDRALSRDGFEVRGISTLGELADAARFEPHLVLMDVNMPDTTGERVIAAVRDAAPAARVVLYSAWEASRLRALCAQLGADGFVSKSESAIAIGGRLRALHGG